MSETIAPTHSIVDAQGNSKKVGLGADLLTLLGTEYPYSKGYRVVEICKVNTTQDGSHQSAVSVERQERHTEGLKRLGLDPTSGFVNPAPVVPVGTRIIESGDGRRTQSRNDHNNRPLIEVALRQFTGTIKDEHRQDVVVPVKALRMLDDGRLVRVNETGAQAYTVHQLVVTTEPKLHMTVTEEAIKGGGAIALEPQALGQLLTFVDGATAVGRHYRDDLDPARRALLFNDRINSMVDDPKDPRKVKLRTRNGQGPRRNYAAVSESYATYDVDKIAAVMADAFEGMDMRGSVVYSPATTMFRAEAGWHEQKTVDFGAGDAFRIGIWVESGDARNSGFNGGLFIERNACKNFIILTYDQIKTFAIRHFGQGFEGKVKAGVEGLAEQAEAMLEIFAEDFGIVSKKKILDVYKVEVIDPVVLASLSPEQILERGMKDVFAQIYDQVDIPGIAKDAAVELMLGGWRLEPGDTADALINAVTRVHELAPIEVVPAFERAGGQLLMQLAV